MDNFIPRRQAPLKEGRSNPFDHSPSYRKQKSAQNRLILIIVALALTGLLGFYYISSSPSSPKIPVAPVFAERPASPPAYPTPKWNQDSATPLDTIPKQQPPVVPASNPYAAPEVKSPLEPEPAQQPPSPVKPKPKQITLSEPTTLPHAPRPGFGEALERVFKLLPDEIHQRELLRNIEGTGKEKLRELGLRTRAYKQLFEAWEDLHLVIDEGATYVRDDIMSYMRKWVETDQDPSHSYASMLRSYESFRFFISQLATQLFPWPAPYFGDHMTLHASLHRGGRGICMTAGDEQAPYLLASIPSFRKLGCTLPIEIFYLGDSDLSEDFRIELEAIDGVTTRDLSQMVTDEGWRLAGWAGKPFTILFSSFREAIFIDADALFFHDPAILFEDPEYKKTGALFFKDRLIMPETKKRWLQAILPKPISKQVRQSRMWTGDSGHMQESGVVVVDTWRHYIALLLVSRLNGPDRDGKKEEGIIGIYDMVYGDKETFWIGWELVGDTDYAFHEGDAGIMGVQEPVYDDPQPNSSTVKFKHEDSPDSEHKDEDHHSDSDEHKDDDHKDDEHSDADHHKDEDHDDDDEDPRHREEAEAHTRRRKRPHARGHESDLTVCAPQLLHLDLSGKPLWFNGWLYHNKFAGREKQGGRFEVYMKEPREVLEPGAWQLEEGNVCCLSNKEVFEFSAEEKGKLEMMIGYAREAGSYVDRKGVKE